LRNYERRVRRLEQNSQLDTSEYTYAIGVDEHGRAKGLHLKDGEPYNGPMPPVNANSKFEIIIPDDLK
jgi:hypothetical protein